MEQLHWKGLADTRIPISLIPSLLMLIVLGVIVGLRCTILFFPEICENIFYALVRDWFGENTVFGRSTIVFDYERSARNLAVLRGMTMLSSPPVASVLNKFPPRLGSELDC